MRCCKVISNPLEIIAGCERGVSLLERFTGVLGIFVVLLAALAGVDRS